MSSIQDAKTKKIPIELDKPRLLYYDLNAFAELEEMYGSVEKAMEAMEAGTIKGIRALLWAGLIHEELDEHGEPKISQKQVGSWLDLTKMEELSEILGRAIEAAVPQARIETPGPLVEKKTQSKPMASPSQNKPVTGQTSQ